MTNLYKDLAEVYEAMYQTFIDYQEEYSFYSSLLRKYGQSNILEIGSGTGNLAPLFAKNGFNYLGLDASQEMINIAQKKNPNQQFIKGDMRNFDLTKPTDAAIVTGRTISYLITNEAVNAAFSAIHKNLKSKGILCFDFIDANRFIPSIFPKKEVIHKATHKNVEYKRKSIWAPHLKNGMDFNWQSIFYKKEQETWHKIGEDVSIPRAFTLNEIEIFLDLNGFNILEIIDREAYAFSTFVAVAERKNK